MDWASLAISAPATATARKPSTRGSSARRRGSRARRRSSDCAGGREQGHAQREHQRQRRARNGGILSIGLRLVLKTHRPAPSPDRSSRPAALRSKTAPEPQPHLEHDQAEQDLVMVARTALVRVQRSPTAAGLRNRYMSDCGSSSIASIWRLSDRWNQSSTTLAANPRFFRRMTSARQEVLRRSRRCRYFRVPQRIFSVASSRCAYSTTVAIEVRHAHLEAVRHRHLVAVHQQLVRQRRLDLEPLKAVSSSALRSQGLQIRPAVENRVARRRAAAGRRWNNPSMRRPGRIENDILIAPEPVRQRRARTGRASATRSAAARERRRPTAVPQRGRRAPPQAAVVNAEMPSIAAEQLVWPLPDRAPP